MTINNTIANEVETITGQNAETNALAGTPYSTPQEDYDIFMAMDDLVVESSTTTTATSDEVGKDLEGDPTEFQAAFEDDVDGSGVEATNEETDYDEVLEENEVEDALLRINDNQEQFAQEFSALPDDLEFIVDGATMTKADISSLVVNQEQAKAHTANLAGHLDRVNALNTAVEASIAAAETETSKQMKYLETQLNSPTLGASQKGQLYDQYQALQQRAQELQNETNNFINVKTERENSLKMANLSNVSSILEADYSVEQIGEVVSYALDLGMTNENLVDNASVPLFEALIKARKYDQSMANTKQRIKQKTTTTTSKPSAKRRAPVATKAAKKQAVINKWDKGDISNVDIFSMLED